MKSDFENWRGSMSSFQSFVNDSGLKVLSMARLTSCEYSLMLYLLNCAASGLDELITTNIEVAGLIGSTSEHEIKTSLESLNERNLIHLRHGEPHPHNGKQSLRIGINKDISTWHLDFDDDVTSHDAIIFPFRRENSLHVVEGHPELSNDRLTISKAAPTWKRILNTFFHEQNPTDDEYEKAKKDAQILIDTHHVDEVLLILRHFGERIPTLSLLASSWEHYLDIFEAEIQKVDLMDARQKHQEQDNRLRQLVDELLTRKEDMSLTPEEITVLKILSSHRHPRRQLFWAYQTRGRYPNLKMFFNQNVKAMLPVTSAGNVVKKKPRQDS